MSARSYDPHAARAAVDAVRWWVKQEASISDGGEPSRALVAAACRAAAATLARCAPGHSVEVRIPPYAAVQCCEGPKHTRGVPPNVVELDPRSWIELVVGVVPWAEISLRSTVSISGTRAAEIARWMPLFPA